MKSALAALLLLVAGGCTVLRDEIGSPIPWKQEQFEEGRTHYRAVLEELGPPLKISRQRGGVAFLYEHLIIHERQVGISYDDQHLGLNIGFLDWIKLTFGKAWANRETLVMTFDRSGTLKTERFKAWRQELGSGTSVQLLVDVGSVVDADDVRTDIDVNDWGQMMLRPLPQTLNAAQSLDDGRYGFEQRGTPHLVGQRALEMRSTESTSLLPTLGGD